MKPSGCGFLFIGRFFVSDLISLLFIHLFKFSISSVSVLVVYMFLHPLSFSLKMFLGLKWVSCRQHVNGSCCLLLLFLIHSVTLYLLIVAFTIKVITDRYVFFKVF